MTEVEAVEELRREGPGRRLREAREARGLSIDDAAGKLHMHVKLVRAIESDDYDALPPPAFVVGYLRNYARLLQLPAQEVLDAYKERRSEPPELADVHSAREAHGGGGTGARLFTWVVVIALLVLLGLWWQQGGALWWTMTAVDEPAEAPEPVRPADGTPEPVGTAVSTVPWVVEPMGTAAHAATESSVAAVDTDAEPPRPAQAEPAAVEPELKLLFESDSWTRVTDADGERLVADLVREGQTRTLTGKAPFELTLGYAPGVVVQYNGVVYDHSRFHARNIARFTVGSADDNPRVE